MSDLQCPATFLVARHGDADHPVHGVLSDHGGWLTELGRRQAEDLGRSLAGRRVAAVHTSTMSRAVQTGDVIADVLGLRAEPVQGLQEFAVGDLAGVPWPDPRVDRVVGAWLAGDLSVGCPGAETGLDVVRRYEAALAELADRYRGETVVVVSHGAATSLVLPRLADNVPDDLARKRFLPNCVPAELTVDADGWRLLSWPGSEDRRVV